ncbi:MAG: helix-turn-helix transcriptional regulator [Phycisphaerales bacterium]|nr:helix-turn-helix transcriptional regulator [Phycisphaerales bacterium]
MPKADMLLLDADAIDRRRVARGYTLNELAARAKLTPATIRSARNGRRISLRSVRQLARALRCSWRTLLSSEQSSPIASDEPVDRIASVA